MKRLRISFEVEWGKDEDSGDDDKPADLSPAVGFVWDPVTSDSDEEAKKR